MSTQDVVSEQVPGRLVTPPAPGTESIGPAMVDLVTEMRSIARMTQALYTDAVRDVRYRYEYVRKQFQCDANGDGAVQIFEVPQGATAALTVLSVDQPGVTPAAPNTSADLWHAIFGGPGGNPTPAQVNAKGEMLDMRPNAPSPDAQIPFAYLYGDVKAAPRLPGPEAFWFVVDAATASAQILLRGIVCIEQPGF